jgi:hypothetical protein
VVVDDVFYTGRTIRGPQRALADLRPVNSVKLVVLVDRGADVSCRCSRPGRGACHTAEHSLELVWDEQGSQPSKYDLPRPFERPAFRFHPFRASRVKFDEIPS